MLGWLTEWYINRLVAKQRAELPAIDWRSLLKRVEDAFQGRASVLLETRDERFISAESQGSNSGDLEFISLIVTWSREGLKPWETEEPARQLAQVLSQCDDVTAVLLLSRRLDSFVGYYVRIRPKLPANGA